MMYTLNLAQLPAATTMEFLFWLKNNKIGNYNDLYRFIALDESWHMRETIPFECSEKEAILVLLRWS